MFLNDLDRLISLGYVSRRKHPYHDLFILNYTPKTQYEGLWNDTTISCRGLIVDSNNKIVARCFKKFFNYEEVIGDVNSRLSCGMSFSMTEKMDGSLGILYWIDKQPFIATRGSFDSEQAIKANEILRSKPTDFLDKNLTYLFEIIYPSNRICVDYGNLEDLVLLSAINTESGDEVELNNHPFSFAERIVPEGDFSSIKAKNLPNKEGFVVRFSDGFRFKIKFDEYIRLHSLIFSISSRSIWKYLTEGKSIPLDSIPDEIYTWVKTEEESVKKSYELLVGEARSVFSSIINLPRKEFALEALKYRYSSLLFSMLDGKPYEDLVWKMIEPEYRTPFKNEKIQENS
jgi:RNA ligase